MKKLNKIFDWRFRKKWLSYITQSAMATVAVLITLVVLHRQNLVVVASLAATAFTIFIIPHSITASPRNVIGGHIIGIIFGSLFALISVKSGLEKDVIYALAVGCATLMMAITNMEHPPAAGTTLGVVIAGYSLPVIMGIIVGITILTIVHWLLKPILLDLIASSETRFPGSPACAPCEAKDKPQNERT